MPIIIDNNYSNNDYGRVSYNSAGAESVRDVSYQTSGARNLTAGSTVTGEIIEKDGDQVTIRMGGDRTISAKLSGDANIEVGMKLTFEVAKGEGNQMALRPLFSNLSSSNAAMSALRAAGLPVNETTLAMTDRMMSESMPVNRNALVDMFRNVSAHSNVSPESIVQMTKLNMPLTESNVIQFDNYRSFEHQITNDLQTVSGEVAELFKEAVTHASAGTEMPGQMTPAEVINEVLDLIDTDGLETIMPGEAAVTQQAAEAAPSQAAQQSSAAEAAQPAAGDTPVQNANEAQVSENAANVVKNTVENFFSGIREMFTSGETVDEASVNPNLSLSPAEQMTLASDLQNILILAGQGSDIHEPLNPSEVMTAVKELVAEYPPENVKVIEAELAAYSEGTGEAADEEKLQEAARSDIAALSGHEESVKGSDTTAQASPENPAGAVQENIANAANAAAESVKAKISGKLSELLKSDGFTKLLKDSVKAQMSIKPQDVARDGKIEELYEKIQRTSARINELMQNIGRGDSVAAKAATSLSDNVNFMHQLNEFVNYVQLPLRMAGEDANGELYVYTNKKNMNNEDGNYSAFLHLDMEHLGPMDVYVTMRDHTKVNTNFYLQTEELLDFIASHIDELTKRLAQKGYDANVKFTQKDPNVPVTPIADEFTKEEADTKVVVSRMRFDVRA